MTFEIVLTRIFSVMLTYHYVYAVVSFSILGLGLGGMLLRRWHRLLPKANYHTNAALFSLMIAGSVVSVVKLPIFESSVLV
ncbi:MAG: hypothetical protein ACE5H0_08235, partial [Bacteroidota bacterium]